MLGFSQFFRVTRVHAVQSVESMGVARLCESSLGRSWTTSLFPDRERSLKRVWFSVEESAVGEAGRSTVLDPVRNWNSSRMAAKE